MHEVVLTQAHLDRFAYRDPNVRLQLDRPEIPDYYRQDYAYRNFGDVLRVIMKTDDTYHPGRPIEVVHSYAVPPLVDGEHIWHFLRECIHKAVMHEADERIWVDGEMIFNPHAHEMPPGGNQWKPVALPESLKKERPN